MFYFSLVPRRWFPNRSHRPTKIQRGRSESLSIQCRAKEQVRGLVSRKPVRLSAVLGILPFVWGLTWLVSSGLITRPYAQQLTLISRRPLSLVQWGGTVCCVVCSFQLSRADFSRPRRNLPLKSTEISAIPNDANRGWRGILVPPIVSRMVVQSSFTSQDLPSCLEAVETLECSLVFCSALAEHTA